MPLTHRPQGNEELSGTQQMPKRTIESYRPEIIILKREKMCGAAVARTIKQASSSTGEQRIPNP